MSFVPKPYKFLADAQVKADLERCMHCKAAPCCDGCPCDCSPMEFIHQLRGGEKSDYQRSAESIYRMNPFGGVCGVVCPDVFCQARCCRKKTDFSIRIPPLQAYICKKCRDLKVPPKVKVAERKPQKFAVVGAGPAGIAAAAYLGASGYCVDLFEKNAMAGGSCNLIPKHRLPRPTLQADIDLWTSLETVNLHLNAEADFEKLAGKYDAVGVTVGRGGARSLGCENEEMCIDFRKFLAEPEKFKESLGRKVVVVGGGPVSVDCAITARMLGADEVMLMYRRGFNELPIEEQEREWLMDAGVDIVCRTLPTKILVKDGKCAGLATVRVSMPHRSTGKAHSVKVEGSEAVWEDVDNVIMAIGQTVDCCVKSEKSNVFFGGDCLHGASTVVEAAASGKNLGAMMESFVLKRPFPIPDPVHGHRAKSNVVIPGLDAPSVDLSIDFFGIRLPDPFVLSASPLTDDYECMKKAFLAGWNAGVMKTAFIGVPIHIPAQYMNRFDRLGGVGSFGNCDNVSSRPLKLQCEDIARLRKEFPDKFVFASTGGPVTSDSKADCVQWQENTRCLENAGAQAVEYSLSCPQGGDGAEGAIVSQNPALSAQIVDYVMQTSDPNIPKLFKLTGAVSSVKPVLRALKAVFDRYPEKKAGVTLANSFPSVVMKDASLAKGTESQGKIGGVVVGAAGGIILPLTLKTLAQASTEGVTISGNGGAMSYKSSLYFIAMGTNSVQYCSLPEAEGLECIQELRDGAAFFMSMKGLQTMKEVGEKPEVVFAK